MWGIVTIRPSSTTTRRRANAPDRSTFSKHIGAIYRQMPTWLTTASLPIPSGAGWKWAAGRTRAGVHVWRGASDLAERGSFELALTSAFIGKSAFMPGDAGVVQAFVSEVRSDVACRAISLAAKSCKPRCCVAVSAARSPLRKRSSGD
jgi:hypothetical protein